MAGVMVLMKAEMLGASKGPTTAVALVAKKVVLMVAMRVGKKVEK